MQVQKQYQFDIKNEAGPEAQLQNDKSNAAVTSPLSKHANSEASIL